MNKEWAFHQWSISDLERHFEVDIEKGLAERRAYFRLTQYGPNSLYKLKDVSVLEILLRQFGNFFILLLAVAMVVSYFVDGFVQALILLLIILANVFLGFYQEYKAENALSELKNRFRSQCKVYREGKIRVIDNERLVPGDIVLLEAGDVVPADMRIIESEGFQTNESALTGESVPIQKGEKPLPADTDLAERINMAYGSTPVVSGRAKGVVVSTGLASEFGKIANLVKKPEEETPLQKQIAFLGKTMTIIAFMAGALIFLLGHLRNMEIFSLLTFAISLIVSVVPESLPTIITLALAIGVSKMAAKKAIVRRMAVIEALGTTSIIATDKTGTLTENELKLEKIFTFEDGKATLFDKEEMEAKSVIKLLEKAVLCTNVSTKKGKELIGDPLDIAIVEKAKSLHAGIVMRGSNFERISEIPFDSENKYTSVIVKNGSHKDLVAKGAPERIINFCALSGGDKKIISKQTADLSQDGYKVVAVAYKHLSANVAGTMSRLSFLGLLAFVDEPSEGVLEAMHKVMSAGIRPLIITGDHPETALYVANKVGLFVDKDEIITGKEMNKLSNSELQKFLKKAKIIARITPEDKIKIVEILQKSGYSLAMTGDGINDAPAIKQATVGIAMGQKGTDIARDSADIVLADDKYGTIVSAVEYGRAIYDNIRNAVVFLLAGNMDELFIIGAAFLFNLPLPLATLQILWINLVTDSFPAVALSFENPSARVLEEKPRSAKTTVLGGSLVYAAYLAAVSFILTLGLYIGELQYSIDKARTMVFCFMVFLELAFAFSIRSKERIWQNPKSFFANRYLLAAIGLSLFMQAIIFLPPLRKIFNLATLNFGNILTLIVLTVITFFAAEIIRFALDRRKK